VPGEFSERKYLMSTATSVPETYELEGDDALRTLRSTGWGQLIKNSFQRFRAADGFSHSRALAYQITLALLPAVIAAVGLATALEASRFRQIITQTAKRLAPGPAGDVITQAISQGAKSGARGGLAALFIGGLAALASATLAMGQIERGANRLYGVEQDRPTAKKYGNGFKLACTAGVLTVVAFVLIVAGADVAKASGLSGVVKGLWTLLRWPLSIGFVVVAFALLFREAPRRRQPSWSWLAVGSGVSVLLWFVFTGLLALYLNLSSDTFGQTYGPLTGIIAIMLWTFLTSLAIYLGLAFAAQLEAVRAGVPGPTSGEQTNPSGRGEARRGTRPAWQ
jgi:YihY family inner membrane protein